MSASPGGTVFWFLTGARLTDMTIVAWVYKAPDLGSSAFKIALWDALLAQKGRVPA